MHRVPKKYFLLIGVALVVVAGAWFVGTKVFSSAPLVEVSPQETIIQPTVALTPPLNTVEGFPTAPQTTVLDGTDVPDAPAGETEQEATGSVVFEKKQISIGGISFMVEIADTQAKQVKGYTGRQEPPRGNGMLYVLAKPSRYSYTAQNMLFDVDIIWIGANRLVVDMTKNITPDSVPASFEPSVPVQYVVEVPAGFIDRNEIVVGSVVDLSAIQ